MAMRVGAVPAAGGGRGLFLAEPFGSAFKQSRMCYKVRPPAKSTVVNAESVSASAPEGRPWQWLRMIG